MNFIADLHIHSRFSRATSKELNPHHLAYWAQCKGIDVLGTGDFTHPAWRAELRDMLVRDEQSGLYRLATPSQQTEQQTLFCLQTEISSIYKRLGKVRKVHNLVYVPTLEDADRLAARLEKIGNLASDGRPILGLDAHDLLEIVLETVPEAVLIPAHIWTPWFSLFGSRSGFDHIEECFGDLTSHIFALETGLSSDPAMNRHVSSLDSFVMVSNSDAHSGANLGREANLFQGQPSFEGIFRALRTAAQRKQPDPAENCTFLGTLEFYPEEGKYHLDGHRACHVSMIPEEAIAHNNICPVCGKPLTVGVLHRVMELADRQEPAVLEREPEAHSLIPLAEVLGELLGTGSASKKVQLQYNKLLRELGPELDILCHLPVADIRQYWDELGEAVQRLREGRVYLQGGFDGEYGIVRVFAPGEMAQHKHQRLPGLAPLTVQKHSHKQSPQPLHLAKEEPLAETFSEEQAQLLAVNADPHLILAGPGAGKTRVLIGRLTYLLQQGVSPDKIVVLTFTRRAANEILERIQQALPGHNLPFCNTLHGYAWQLIQKIQPETLLLAEDEAFALFASLAKQNHNKRRIRPLWETLQKAREAKTTDLLSPDLASLAEQYEQSKREQKGLLWLDFLDLVEWLENNACQLATRPDYLLVDEFQDLSPLQLEAIRQLLPPDGQGFFGIGDPDQAIYAFRGASGQNAQTLTAIWPKLTAHHLEQSFRASQSVLDLAKNVLQNRGQCGELRAVKTLPTTLRLFVAPDEQAEATWIAKCIVRLIGATAHTLLDQQHKSTDVLDASLSPGEIAVLVRMKSQLPLVAETLHKFGLPCTMPSEKEFWQDARCAKLLLLCANHCGRKLPHLHVEENSDATESLPWLPGQLPAPMEMQTWLTAVPWAGSLFVQGSQFRALCSLWHQCGNWQTFFAKIAWLNEAELAERKAEQVRLLTLHASKGLEFKAVFLPGLENGILPLQKTLLFPAEQADPELRTLESDIEEERRLFYVGLTRASQGLFLSFCKQRKIYGRTLQLEPSPFLEQARSFCRQSVLTKHIKTMAQQSSLLV